jgi:hypothetical protein
LPEKKDERRKLRYYGLLLVVGLIVVAIGLLTLPSGLVAALLGVGVGAVGGIGVSITYNKHDSSIKASQSGKDNTQINQASPVGSPAIGTARDVYIGTPMQQTPSQAEKHVNMGVSEPKTEQVWSGVIHLAGHQGFKISLNEEDTIKGHVESENPVSVGILTSKEYGNFSKLNPKYWEFRFYYHTPPTTNCDPSYTATSRFRGYIVIFDVTEPKRRNYDRFQVTAKIIIERNNKVKETEG